MAALSATDPHSVNEYLATVIGYARSPELRLCARVLEDAIETVVKCSKPTVLRSRHEYWEAVDWFNEPEDLKNGWVFAFVNVCDFLDLSPSKLLQDLKPFLRTGPRPKFKEPAKGRPKGNHQPAGKVARIGSNDEIKAILKGW